MAPAGKKKAEKEAPEEAPAEEAPAEEPTKENPDAQKKGAKPENPKKNDVEIPDDAYVNWQLYRSREQIYASVLDHDAKVEGKVGKAGDYIAYDESKGEYFLLPADEFPNFQPIAPSERAKQP